VRRVDVTDPAELAALRARVRATVTGTQPVSALSPADAALASLVVVGHVPDTVNRQERRAHADRITALGERGGAAVPALAGILRQIRIARAAAQSSYGG
jgi:hypothetical protein